MLITDYVKKLIENRILRLLVLKIVRSIAFKLLISAVIIFLSLSAAVYYVEEKNVKYIYEGGVRKEDKENSSNIRSFEDSIWWAVVTSTTVGYGDYYPKTVSGRFSGIILMFFGVSLVGVITGNIASFLVEKQLKEGRGLKGMKLKNHFIICGWKRDMARRFAGYHGKEQGFSVVGDSFSSIPLTPSSSRTSGPRKYSRASTSSTAISSMSGCSTAPI